MKKRKSRREVYMSVERWADPKVREKVHSRMDEVPKFLDIVPQDDSQGTRKPLR
jgi:hypothetical protein